MFALEFDINMLTADEQERAKNHNVKSAPDNKTQTVLSSLKERGDKVLIVTTRALLENASANFKSWGNALVLGGDGIWGISKNKQTCMVPLGVFSNYLNGKAESVHTFQVWGLVWSFSENATMVCALYAALRAYMPKYGLNVPAEVSMWNSDMHLSYSCLREIFFPEALHLPCAVHTQRELNGLKSSFGEAHLKQAQNHLSALKHAQNDTVFNHALTLIVKHWEGVKPAIGKWFAKLRARPHFSMGQSRFPGFAPNNQSIESVMGTIRIMTGNRSSQVKANLVLHELLGTVMYALTDRVVDNVKANLHAPATHVGSMTVSTFQQLKALQVADENGYNVMRFTTRDCDVAVIAAFQQTNEEEEESRVRNIWKLRVKDITPEFAITFVAMMTHVEHESWSLTLDDVRSHCVVRKITPEDYPQIPDGLRKHLHKTKFVCSCGTFQSSSQCGHAAMAKFIYDKRFDPENNDKLHYSKFEDTYIAQNKGYRRQRQPGENKRAPKSRKVELVTQPVSPRVKTKAAEVKFVKTHFTCDERIDMLKRDFHRAPGADKCTLKAAEALWLMIKDDSAGVNDFDKLEKEWSAMVTQRGTSNEDAARYIVFLRTSRISEAAFQWHPTFFKIFYSVSTDAKIPFWLIPENILSDEDMQARYRSTPYMCTYAGVKLLVTWEDIFRDSTHPTRWIDDVFMNAAATIIQHHLRGCEVDCAILPTHLSSYERHDKEQEQKIREAYSVCEFGTSHQWILKEHIFIPWHVNSAHWYLYHIHVCRSGKITIASYDSMGSASLDDLQVPSDSRMLSPIRKSNSHGHGTQSNEKKQSHRWLKLFLTFAFDHAGHAAMKRFVQKEKTTLEFYDKYGKAPAQRDGSSCGILTLTNLLMSGLNIDLNELTYHTVRDENFLRRAYRSAILQAGERGLDDLHASSWGAKATPMALRSTSVAGKVITFT